MSDSSQLSTTDQTASSNNLPTLEEAVGLLRLVLEEVGDGTTKPILVAGRFVAAICRVIKVDVRANPTGRSGATEGYPDVIRHLCQAVADPVRAAEVEADEDEEV